MTLPGDLSTVTVTAKFLDPAGAPLAGAVTLTPSAEVTDATGRVVIPATPRTFPLQRGSLTTAPLVATDNADLSPAGWRYEVQVDLMGAPGFSFTAALASSPSTVDLSALLAG